MSIIGIPATGLRHWGDADAGKVIEAARRREIDVVLVWRLDRWGRSVADLLATLQELEHLGVGFVSLTEALDLTLSAAADKLAAGLTEFEIYTRNNRDFIPNFGERYHQGETISTAFVESTINQVVSRR